MGHYTLYLFPCDERSLLQSYLCRCCWEHSHFWVRGQHGERERKAFQNAVPPRRIGIKGLQCLKKTSAHSDLSVVVGKFRDCAGGYHFKYSLSALGQKLIYNRLNYHEPATKGANVASSVWSAISQECALLKLMVPSYSANCKVWITHTLVRASIHH
jgi:hypothetical protein